MTDKSNKSNKSSSKNKKPVSKKANNKSSTKKKTDYLGKKVLHKVLIVSLFILLVALVALKFNMSRFSGDGQDAAIIDGEPLSMQELDAQYELIFAINNLPEDYRQILTKESVLDQMINQEILLDKASEEDIHISDQELEQELQSLFRNSPISQEEFESDLAEKGLTMDLFQKYYRNQMIITKLLNQTLFSEIDVSEDQARAFYENNTERYSAQESQVRLRHILVESKNQAEDILYRLKKGAEFEELAEKYSTCPSSSQGGSLGFVSKGQMVPEFEKSAFRLNVNQLSDVVETQFGYHIIKRDPDKLSFSEAEESIMETLYSQKQKELFEEYMESLKKDAEIENLLLESSQKPESEETALSSASEPAGTAEEETDACFTGYGLDSGTVIFYHADWCPHCQNMVPIVEELEDKGYSFHLAETTSKQGTDVVESCFSDVLQGGVPQFICSGSREYLMGSMSKAALKEFADSCQ